MIECTPYFCPTSGEMECCPAHSGFDVCCDHPDLHTYSESGKMTTDKPSLPVVRTQVKPNIGFTVHREHLPNYAHIEILDSYTQDQWNEIIEFLADAANRQPFGDPYFWQSHDKHSFVRWLRSWKTQ